VLDQAAPTAAMIEAGSRFKGVEKRLIGHFTPSPLPFPCIKIDGIVVGRFWLQTVHIHTHEEDCCGMILIQVDVLEVYV